MGHANCDKIKFSSRFESMRTSKGGLPSWMTSRGHCGRVCERISVCVLVNYSQYTLALFYCTLIVIPRRYDSPMDLSRTRYGVHARPWRRGRASVGNFSHFRSLSNFYLFFPVRSLIVNLCLAPNLPCLCAHAYILRVDFC